MLLLFKHVLLFALGICSIDCHLKDKAKRIYIGSASTTHEFETDSAYKSMLAQEFNCITPGNSMKWQSVENTRGKVDYSTADRLVAFGEQHGMKIRGHTLIWHNQLPAWVPGLENKKIELEEAIKKHITDEMTHFKGKIYAWDVLNEIFNDDGSYRDSVFHKTLGTDFIALAFRTAHAVDANAKLYINDYSVEGKNKKSDALYNLVKSLKAQGVPVHGVGFQAHLILDQIPQDLQSNLQRFSDLGVDVAITELDIRIKLPSNQQSLQRQATDYEKVFNACLSVHRCVGVTLWDFTDKYSWIPSVFPGQGDACAWDKDLKPKPAVEAINKVLK